MDSLIQLLLIPLCVSIVGSVIYGFLFNRKKDYSITWEKISLRQYNVKESDDVQISLSYKNSSIEDSLYVVSLRLTNNGKKDIPFKQIFEDKIKIVIDDLKIVDVQIEQQSDYVSAAVDKVDNTDQPDWFISWGILKAKETIDLKIVAVNNKKESDIIWDIPNKLSFQFRGSNIDSISFKKSPARRRFVFFIILYVIASLFYMATIPMRCRVNYDVVVDSSRYNDVYILYDGYTHEYVIMSNHNRAICRTDSLDKIELSEQHVITISILMQEMVILVSLITFLCVFVFFRHKRILKEPDDAIDDFFES